MKITDHSEDAVTLSTDVTTARNIVLGATVAAMVVTMSGMALNSTPLVIGGGICVLVLYAVFIFGLETLHATLDLVDGTAEVERLRRGKAVARAIVPLERVLPTARDEDPASTLVRNLNSTVATMSSKIAPTPAMAPTDARRVLAWAANA